MWRFSRCLPLTSLQLPPQSGPRAWLSDAMTLPSFLNSPCETTLTPTPTWCPEWAVREDLSQLIGPLAALLTELTSQQQLQFISSKQSLLVMCCLLRPFVEIDRWPILTQCTFNDLIFIHIDMRQMNRLCIYTCSERIYTVYVQYSGQRWWVHSWVVAQGEDYVSVSFFLLLFQHSKLCCLWESADWIHHIGFMFFPITFGYSWLVFMFCLSVYWYATKLGFPLNRSLFQTHVNARPLWKAESTLTYWP